MRTVALRYDEHYSIPVGISMDDCISDPFGVATAEPRRVRVHIFNKQAFFEKEKIWPKGSVLTECEDGSIILELTIVDPSAFHAWALSLGENCHVESPDDLAEWVRVSHEKALGLYKGATHEE